MFKTTLNLGKIDYNRSGRKNCLLEIEINIEHKVLAKRTTNLDDVIEYHTFSMVIGIWNPRKTDYYTFGQLYDTVREFPRTKNKHIGRLLEIGEKWHLNDMRLGTVEQNKFADTLIDREYSYVCKQLDLVGLYEYRGYKYGREWLLEPIPQEIIDEVIELVGKLQKQFDQTI